MWKWWLTVFALVCGGHAGAQSSKTLTVGITPTLTAKALLIQYQPLRAYLERELRRPVNIVTATDFQKFHADVLAGEFDMALSAAHLARHAQVEAKYRPVATYTSPNHPLFVMASVRPVAHINELRGKTLAVFDPLALVVLQAHHWLEDNGLKAGRDFRVAVFPSHASVAHAVANGEVLLGVTATVALGRYPAELKPQVQVFKELPPVSALVWLTHPRMETDAQALQAAMVRFGESPEGHQFFTQSGYQGLRAVATHELAPLDRAAREAVAQMKAARP
jgi:phosphonate transport system substrate-binding protein